MCSSFLITKELLEYSNNVFPLCHHMLLFKLHISFRKELAFSARQYKSHSASITTAWLLPEAWEFEVSGSTLAVPRSTLFWTEISVAVPGITLPVLYIKYESIPFANHCIILSFYILQVVSTFLELGFITRFSWYFIG